MPRRRVDHGRRPYVNVETRRRRAKRVAAAMEAQGRVLDPVSVENRRQVAHTLWGKAWCQHLEAYSDYANRLPRGRGYVRNGSVMDLQVSHGRITAMISGTSIYEVEIKIKPIGKPAWRKLAKECSGQVHSVVDLLEGTLSDGVMAILAKPNGGLFPTPQTITMGCTCPDWAMVCKHVAAALYGVGARLDHSPELLFLLRGVDPTELVEDIGDLSTLLAGDGPRSRRVIENEDLSAIFGIAIDGDAGGVQTSSPAPNAADRASPKPKNRAVKKKTARKKKTKAGRKKKATAGQKGRNTPARKKTKTRKSHHQSRQDGGSLPRTISAQELIAIGVPRSTFQNWIRAGVLLRTDKRGVYRTTKTTKTRVDCVLKKRRP